MDSDNLSYNHLLLVAGTTSFYDMVQTQEEILEYMQAVHNAYCKKYNLKQAKVIISKDIGENTLVSFNYYDKKIHVNSKVLEMFRKMKINNNKYYPYELLINIIHESRHLWQFQNLQNIHDSKLSKGEQLALYSLDKTNDEIIETIKNNKNIKRIFKKRNIFLLSEEKKLESWNFPNELDANEEVIEVLKYINSITHSISSSFVLNEFLKYQKKQIENSNWSIYKEYLDESKNVNRKKRYNVIVRLYQDYLVESVKERHKGNDFFNVEEYTLNLFPTLKESINNIKENKKDNKMMKDDYTKFVETFKSKPKILPK